MGKEYKIIVTCENKNSYTSQWFNNENGGPEIVDLLKNEISKLSYISFVNEFGNTIIFPKECLMKSVIQIEERTV